MSKEEEQTNERIRVALLLVLLSWLEPNKTTNTENAKTNVVNAFINNAKAMLGDGIMAMVTHFGVRTVDGKSLLCYLQEDEDPDGGLWRLVGQYFKDLGAPVGNLSPPKKGSKPSGWTIGNRNAMAVKVLVWLGIGEGKNSTAFKWTTFKKDNGKIGMNIKTMIQGYLSATSDALIHIFTGEEETDADDEEDAWEFEGEEEVLEEDDFSVEVSDAVIDPLTMSTLRTHYNESLGKTEIRHDVDMKSDAPAWMYGLFYTMMQFANGNGGTGDVLNLFYRKNVNSKTNSLYYSEVALAAIKKGKGTEYTSVNKRKNTKTIKTVQDLRDDTSSTLLGRCQRMVFTSLHLNVNNVYDFCQDLEIDHDNFMAYAMRLIINSIENGANADKLGYGFIQEIDRVGNMPLYESLMSFYGINLDGDEKHTKLFATMSKSASSSEKAGKWDNWEEDIIQ